MVKLLIYFILSFSVSTYLLGAHTFYCHRLTIKIPLKKCLFFPYKRVYTYINLITLVAKNVELKYFVFDKYFI